MANSSSTPQSEPAVIEQVITEFFAKSLHIILESRSPYVSSRNYSGNLFTSSPSSSSPSSSVRPRDKWFNLALRDCPAALENFDLWRQSNLDPLIIDIILIRQALEPEVAYRPPGGCLLTTLSAKDSSSNCWSPGKDNFLREGKSEKIVERWVVQYEARKSGGIAKEMCLSRKKSGGIANSYYSEMPVMYHEAYTRSIVLLRSLYVTVRLLPAYKLFRDLNSSGQLHPFSLAHRISSFVEPFTWKQEAEMNQFSFAPVETSCGRLCLSVSYLPKLEDVSSGPSTPLSTLFIVDYVGSPATVPVKRFQSLPTARSLPTYISFARRHCCSDNYEATPPVSSSPSPTYSDSHALNYNRNPNRPTCHHPHGNSPSGCCVPHDPSWAHKKKVSFDECWPSPPFASPSPPPHLLGGQPANALVYTQTALVRTPMLGWSNALLNQALPPSPSPKGTRHGNSSQVDNLRAQVATASQTSSLESKLQVQKEPQKLGDFQTGMALQKVVSFGKDEAGSLPGLKLSSCSSLQITIPRSSSRLSFLNEFDDTEFVCPFAPDGEDVSDSCNRVEPLDGKGQPGEYLESGGLITVRKSKDSAVGALVKMFKAAAPLQQDFFSSVRSSLVPREEAFNQRMESNVAVEVAVGRLGCDASSSGMSASGHSKSKTAADALEELRSYQEMKELLLRNRKMEESSLRLGGSQSLNEGQAAESAGKGSSEF